MVDMDLETKKRQLLENGFCVVPAC